MNETLFLAEKILVVLSESGQALESKCAAIEIVRTLQRAEPYGTLALLNEAVSSDAPTRTHSKPRTDSD